MKKELIKVLQVTRKFGLIMAVVMMFPYVSGLPSVMASDGNDKQKSSEISNDELRDQYSEFKITENAMKELQKDIEAMFQKAWFIEIEPGVY